MDRESFAKTNIGKHALRNGRNIDERVTLRDLAQLEADGAIKVTAPDGGESAAPASESAKKKAGKK